MTTPETLHIQLLGELAVSHGDQRLTLPPSKKTRALLAYLVLTERAHRRDRLCQLFWDVTDDPRGALRWSLSKLRPVLEPDGEPRLVAERESVRFERRQCTVDALALRDALRGRSPSGLTTEELERLVERYEGELLEGLELPDFDDYQAWCLAEREELRVLRADMLRELVSREEGAPQRVLAHARRWVSADPLNESARAALVRLLGRLGRRDEARQHYEAGLRLDAELGRKSRGELHEAFRAIEVAQASVPEAQAPLSAPPRPAVDASDDARPFVGRAEERDLLDAAFGRCTAGRIELVLFSGEPGVGKTRLLEAWARSAEARGARVLFAAAYEAESGHPYAPWLEALHGMREGQHALATLTQSTSLGVEERSSDAGRGREQLFASVSSALEGLVEGKSSLVLVLDDVQWLDEGSCELLHYVVRKARKRPLMIVLACREGEQADNSALARVLRSLRREGVLSEHALGPLSEPETATLVRALEPSADAERIARESAGNPLYAIELARARQREGVPATLSSLVRDRLAQLMPEAADLLRWAAVLGCGFRIDRIAALTSLRTEALLDALELLTQRGLLRLERDRVDSYEFSHELVRRIVYTDLSEPRRRLMHRRVAELLRSQPEASPEHVGEVARHAALAHDADLAAEACLAAARRSLRLFANADAYTLARRGMRHAERLTEPARTRLLLELFDVSFGARRPEEPVDAAREIEALAERALDAGDLEHARLGFHLLSYLKFERGEWADARKHTLQAELVSRGGSERERVLGLAEAARCLVLLERDLGHAQALVLEAAARARHASVQAAAIFDALGMLKLHEGQVAEAERELEEARALAHATRDRHDEFQALEHLVMLAMEQGNFELALARARELCELGEKMRDGSEAPFARSLFAVCQLALAQQGADEALERELAMLMAADAKHRLLYVLTRAALFNLEQHAIEEARLRAERAFEIAELLERPSERVLSHVVLARCARALGNDDVRRAHHAALRGAELAWVSANARRLAEQELAHGEA